MTGALLVLHGTRTLFVGMAFGVGIAWLVVEACDLLASRFPPDRRRHWRRGRRERW